MTRAERAGQDLAKAIIEMVRLMYQNNTAENFYKGLSREIKKEMDLRMIEDRRKFIRSEQKKRS